jgi:predicted histidine transporter YuiF (NhaC family)
MMALHLYVPAMLMLGFAVLSAIVVMLVKEATGATGRPISWRV